MIILDRPADSLEILSVLMVHGQEIRCPEPVFPIFVNRMKHTDKPVFLHMNCHAVVRNHKGRDRAVLRIVRIHHPILFNSGKPVPAEPGDTLQVVNAGIPTVKHDEVWLKSPG